jgi:hypothetical protein
MQTDPTIDPIKQPPDAVPETDPLAPGAEPQEEDDPDPSLPTEQDLPGDGSRWSDGS